MVAVSTVDGDTLFTSGSAGCARDVANRGHSTRCPKPSTVRDVVGERHSRPWSWHGDRRPSVVHVVRAGESEPDSRSAANLAANLPRVRQTLAVPRRATQPVSCGNTSSADANGARQTPKTHMTRRGSGVRIPYRPPQICCSERFRLADCTRSLSPRLQRHREEAKLLGTYDPEGFVFCTRTGSPMTMSNMRRAFRTRCAKAGLGEDWTTYELAPGGSLRCRCPTARPLPPAAQPRRPGRGSRSRRRGW